MPTDRVIVDCFQIWSRCDYINSSCRQLTRGGPPTSGLGGGYHKIYYVTKCHTWPRTLMNYFEGPKEWEMDTRNLDKRFTENSSKRITEELKGNKHNESCLTRHGCKRPVQCLGWNTHCWWPMYNALQTSSASSEWPQSRYCGCSYPGHLTPSAAHVSSCAVFQPVRSNVCRYVCKCSNKQCCVSCHALPPTFNIFIR